MAKISPQDIRSRLYSQCEFCGEMQLDTWNCQMKQSQPIICSNCCTQLQTSKDKRNICRKPSCAFCWNRKAVIRCLSSK